MPEDGDFLTFFRPGGQSFALKAVPGAEILTEKMVARGLAGGWWGNQSN